MKSEYQEKEEQDARNHKEIYYKNSYYKNINSIRKNIQFFFWLTVIPAICYILFFILASDSFI